ncbi:MAG: TetR/AcrR family transcriptional regulator [Desulfovibrionaceae bacterium]|nr:TetR/AcrR family transcriptional regulator [Desulfovibrionaceae bacterium]
MKTSSSLSPSAAASPDAVAMQARDRLSTRAALLEVAGQVFAERGYAEATSKEICQRAGVNGASVNYHFGSKEKLYGEVLIEGHRRLKDLDELERMVDSDLDPKEKLRLFLLDTLQKALDADKLWSVKIFMREQLAPTPMGIERLRAAAMPKFMKFRELVHQLTGFPMDSSQLQWAAAMVLLPMVSIFLVPQTMRPIAFPRSDNVNEMLDTMLTYALGGLAALKNRDCDPSAGRAGESGANSGA